MTTQRDEARRDETQASALRARLVRVARLAPLPQHARLVGAGAEPAGDAAVPPSWQRTSVSAAGLAQTSGVNLVRVAVSGDGGRLDLRFQVVDPSKTVALHGARTPPAIVDERTGLVINKLFMGDSHGPYKAAVSYYLVFENPRNWVHPSSRVTVLLGDAQVEHVVVT